MIDILCHPTYPLILSFHVAFTKVILLKRTEMCLKIKHLKLSRLRTRESFVSNVSFVSVV